LLKPKKILLDSMRSQTFFVQKCVSVFSPWHQPSDTISSNPYFLCMSKLVKHVKKGIKGKLFSRKYHAAAARHGHPACAEAEDGFVLMPLPRRRGATRRAPAVLPPPRPLASRAPSVSAPLVLEQQKVAAPSVHAPSYLNNTRWP